MNTISDETTANPKIAGDRTGKGTVRARLRAWARVVRQGWLQVFGIPDYDRYLAHRAVHHAGEAVLSRRDFFAQAIDRKYCRTGPRCC